MLLRGDALSGRISTPVQIQMEDGPMIFISIIY